MKPTIPALAAAAVLAWAFLRAGPHDAPVTRLAPDPHKTPSARQGTTPAWRGPSVLSEHDDPTIPHRGTVFAIISEAAQPDGGDTRAFRDRLLVLRKAVMDRVEARVEASGVPHQARYLVGVNMMFYWSPDPERLRRVLDATPGVAETVFLVDDEDEAPGSPRPSIPGGR